MHPVIILLLTLSIVQGNYYELTPIDNLFGVYLEPQGHLKNRIDNWKTEIQINLETLNRSVSNLQSSMVGFRCPEALTECRLYLSRAFYLEYKIQNMNIYIHELNDLITHEENTLDISTDDNPRYISKYNSTLSNRINKLEQLNNATLRQYHSVIRKALETPPSSREIFSVAQLWLNNVEFIIDNMINIYQNIIQTIKEAQDGKISTFLLSLNQIHQIEKDISIHKPELEFPIIRTRTSPLNKIIISRIKKISKYVIIEFTFPLFTKNNYDMYQIHSIPIPQGDGTSIYIHTDNPYVAIDNTKKNHIYFNDRQLLDCIQHNNVHYCDLKITTDVTLCDRRILNKSDSPIINDCDSRIKNQQNIEWTYLPFTDKWIYSTPKKIGMLIKCPGNRDFNITLKGIGFLKINKDCVTHNNDTSSLSLKFIKPVKQKLTMKGAKSTINSSINKQKDSFNTTERFTIQIRYLRYMNYASLISISTIFIIIIMMLIKQNCKLVKANQSTNTYTAIHNVDDVELIIKSSDSTAQEKSDNSTMKKNVRFNLHPERIKAKNPLSIIEEIEEASI